MSKLSNIGHALYEGKVSIDFVGRKWLWYAISAGIVAIALFGLLGRGFNLGIEFKGGVEYRVVMPSGQANQAAVERIRDAVAREAGDSDIAAASAPVVNTSGSNTIRIQTEPLSNDEAKQISGAVQKAAGVPERSVSQDEIGATWGSQVANRALLGLVVFLFLVILFIWAYFREWKMSVGAIVALAHDLVITVGVYALSGFEVTPATVTGILTILGFSLYDTVVVFDKVRENTKNLRASRTTYARAANLAVNQTLVRSINTSLVALIPVGAILYVSAVQLGASSLKDLALALFVGMAAGTYSSIFIATPLLVHLKSNETEIVMAERRAKARERRQADRYASVPAFTEDLPIEDPDATPGRGGVLVEERDEFDDELDGPAGGVAPRRPAPEPEAMGRGRTAPTQQRPVGRSSSSGRQQPTRQPRSKRK